MIYSALAMWLGWWGVWLFAWPKVASNWLEAIDLAHAPEPERESLWERGKHWLPLVIGICMIFETTVHTPSEKFLIHLPGYVKWLGLFFTGFGLVFASYSRLYLANNWSARVEIQHDHELISEGPYSVVRHPIYNGLIGAFMGTAMVAGTWEALAGVGLVTLAFMIKASHEEAMLAKEFPEGYSVLRRMVPYKIFPWIY